MSADLFHEWAIARNFGGRQDSATLSPSASIFVGFLRKIGEQWIAATVSTYPKLPSIHLDFAASESVNAVAFLHKGQRFIGVTLGAVAAIGIMFERMLSDRRILPNIGDPRKDVDHRPLKGPFLPAILDDNRRNGPTPPLDRIRAEYAEFLCRLAFNFLLFHELTHILNGHVDYLADQNHSQFIAEFGWMPDNEEAAVERHALEMEADIGAVWRVVDLVSQWTKKPPSDNPHMQDYDSLLFAQLFAIFSFFRVFGDAPHSETELYRYAHPPLRMRVGYSWKAAKDCAELRHGFVHEQVMPTVQQAAISVEQSFHYLTGMPVTDTMRYGDALGLLGRNHRARIFKVWNMGLRTTLQTYTYAPSMVFEG